MIINKAETNTFLSTEEVSIKSSSFGKKAESKKAYDVVSSFEGDPFVGHLSTPITTSCVQKRQQ